MKVLLLAIFSDVMYENIEELGICYIASVLRENGYEVMLCGKKENMIDYPSIRQFKPDIIGLPVYAASKHAVYNFCKKISEMLPDTYICLGGYLATFHSTEILEEAPFVDFIIRGEGEITWLELLSALEKGESLDKIKGLTYREGQEIKFNEDRDIIEDLDTLPFPARDMLVDNNIKICSISTSRGCTSRCSFCCTHHFWKKWRGRSPKIIADEIELMYKKYNMRIFHFIDGSFEDPDIKHERLVNIAKEIIGRNLDISYAAEFRADFYRRVDFDVMKLLKQSGLIGVHVGIESANEHDIRLFRKRSKLEDNYRIIDFFRKWGIELDIGFINFNPYSSLEGLKKNIDYLDSNHIAYSMSFITNSYRAFKGTDLYKKILEDGLFKEGSIEDFYKYEYLDNRVKELYCYVNDYIEYVNRNYNNAFVIFHFPDYLIILNHFKKCFSRDERHVKAYNYVLEHKANMEALLYELSRSNAAWFRELIRLAEKNWNRSAADKISEELLGGDYMRKMKSKILKERDKFQYKLMQLGEEYKEYISYLDL